MIPAVGVWFAPLFLIAVAGTGGAWLEPYQRAEGLRAEGAYSAAGAHYDSALQEAQQAGDRCPGMALIETGVAALHQKQNRLGEGEAAAMEALALWKGCPSPHPQESAATLRILAVIRSDQGRYPESVALFRQALETLPDGPLTAALRADITSQLGMVYFLQGKRAEAESTYNLSLDLNEAADPPDALVKASILDKLGQSHFTRNKYAEAQRCYESALQLREHDPRSHPPELDGTRIHLARLYYARGLWAKAESIFRAVLRSSETRLGSAHPQVIVLHNDLAVLYRSEGKTRAAEDLFRRALAAWEKSGASRSVYAAAVLLNLGGVVEQQGHLAEAEQDCRRALAILEGAGAAGALYRGTAWNNLGRLQYRRREYEAAAQSFRRAVEIWDEPSGDPRSASALHNLAAVEIAQRHFSEAEAHLRAALDLWERNPRGELDAGQAVCLRDYAALLKRSGRTQEAAGLQARAGALEARIREQQRLAQLTVDVRDLPATR